MMEISENSHKLFWQEPKWIFAVLHELMSLNSIKFSSVYIGLEEIAIVPYLVRVCSKCVGVYVKVGSVGVFDCSRPHYLEFDQIFLSLYRFGNNGNCVVSCEGV